MDKSTQLLKRLIDSIDEFNKANNTPEMPDSIINTNEGSNYAIVYFEAKEYLIWLNEANGQAD